MSLIDLNFSAGKVKTKQNKRKMRIYLIFYLYRDVEAPPRIDTDISLGDVKCVLDRQSSNPYHAPHFPHHHTHLVTVTTTKNKKILCQFPWADDGGHQSPQYTTVYSIYLAILYTCFSILENVYKRIFSAVFANFKCSSRPGTVICISICTLYNRKLK